MSFESDFRPHNNIQWRGNTGIVNYDDGGMVVLFYYRPTLDAIQSKESGRPIYKDIEYVKYHPPTERLNINDRPATDEHRRRWPLQYQQFQQNKAQVNEGTPVDQLYPEHPSIAAQCRASSVFTVEQLASLEGTQIDALGMGAQRWVNYARKYLEMANTSVKAVQYRADMEKLEGQLRVVIEQNKQLQEENNRLRAGGTGMGSLPFSADQVAALQALLNRPQSVAPNAGQNFDAATAQINATHPTAEITNKANTQTGKRK